MKKIVLVDGNNLLFRSYYATLYTGNIMRNKDGFPTNGVYGFVNMINKIVNDEKPEYMMVAFDIGKTFRHEKYERYKDGRKEKEKDTRIFGRCARVGGYRISQDLPQLQKISRRRRARYENAHDLPERHLPGTRFDDDGLLSRKDRSREQLLVLSRQQRG